jgi:hypothetical protein
LGCNKAHDQARLTHTRTYSLSFSLSLNTTLPVDSIAVACIPTTAASPSVLHHPVGVCGWALRARKQAYRCPLHALVGCIVGEPSQSPGELCTPAVTPVCCLCRSSSRDPSPRCARASHHVGWHGQSWTIRASCRHKVMPRVRRSKLETTKLSAPAIPRVNSSRSI